MLRMMRGLAVVTALCAPASALRAESVPAYPAFAPAAALAAKPPRLVGQSLLYRRQGNAPIALKMSGMRADGALVAIVHEGGLDDIEPSKLIHIVVTPDGSVRASKALDFDRLVQTESRRDTGRYIVRADGTAAYLETRDGVTRLVEIAPDGGAKRIEIAGGLPGYLVSELGDGYLALVPVPAAEGKPAASMLVVVERGGRVVTRHPWPISHRERELRAVPVAGGRAMLFWLPERASGSRRDRIAWTLLRGDGPIEKRGQSEFPAVGPFQVLGEARGLPPDGRGGFLLSGTAFGSGDPFCLWLGADARIRLAVNLGATRSRARDCPSGALLVLADGGAIGMRQHSDGADLPKSESLEPGQEDVLRIDRNGRRLWRFARPKPDAPVDAILAGADASLWLLGTDQLGYDATSIRAERYSWH